ncbi:hypothetical protein AAG906_031891 [Vitis piasezkii]
MRDVKYTIGLCSEDESFIFFSTIEFSTENYQKCYGACQPVNEEGVMATTGSLDSEAGIYALSYDITGSRLVTCEANRIIKMWKEDENATPETHFLNFKPPKDVRRF